MSLWFWFWVWSFCTSDFDFEFWFQITFRWVIFDFDFKSLFGVWFWFLIWNHFISNLSQHWGQLRPTIAVGARIEAPKAPRREVRCGQGVSPGVSHPHRGRGLERGLKFFFDFWAQKASFGASWMIGLFFCSWSINLNWMETQGTQLRPGWGGTDMCSEEKMTTCKVNHRAGALWTIELRKTKELKTNWHHQVDLGRPTFRRSYDSRRKTLSNCDKWRRRTRVTDHSLN